MINTNELAKSCRMIACDSPNFDDEVMDALRTDRVFALTGLSEALKTSMKDLIESGDDFFDHFHEVPTDIYPPIVENNNIQGFFHPKTHPLGSNNGARFFMAMNKKGGINNERTPLCRGRPMILDASKTFNDETNHITRRILGTIEQALNLIPETLQEVIIGNSAIALSRFLPITQKRAAHMFEEKVLVVKDDGVEQVSEHRDVSPITMLAYRGEDTCGLMVQDRGTKKQVSLKIDAKGAPYLLVFTGILLNELTNGHIAALKHQVVTTPEFQHTAAQNDPHSWRFTIAKFTFLNTQEISPVKTRDGHPIGSLKKNRQDKQYPVIQDTIIKSHFAKQKKTREDSNVKVFPLELAQKYPTEVEFKELYEAQLGEENIGVYRQP